MRAQDLVTGFSVLVASVGGIVAMIGAWREATSSPGQGIMMVVVGGLVMGLAMIVITIAAKLLGQS